MAGLSKLLKSSSRPQSIQPIDIQAAAAWGVAAGVTALWVVQPFDWIRKTFFEKPAPEAK